MAEDRRLKIAKRQLMLAQIARREARFALASALAEEERSGQIEARARDLLREYGNRALKGDAASQSHTLQANLAFVRSLQTMADNAQSAHKDAADQARWQMQALSMAETRLDTHEARVGEEKRSLADQRKRRELPPELTGSAGMARKLHNSEQAGDEAVRKGPR
jgi:hypothetical protein